MSHNLLYYLMSRLSSKDIIQLSCLLRSSEQRIPRYLTVIEVLLVLFEIYLLLPLQKLDELIDDNGQSGITTMAGALQLISNPKS
jgi:hypothetical protein